MTLIDTAPAAAAPLASADPVSGHRATFDLASSSVRELNAALHAND